MSMGSLGGASFTVKADTKSFEDGMKRAKAEAIRSTQVISAGVAQVNQTVSPQLVQVGLKAEETAKSLKKIGDQLGTSKSSHFALGLMAVGQAVDDLQYGFRSIVNNIPQMVYLMGGNAGIAGGAAIAAVAVNQLVNHCDQLTDLFRAGWLNVAANDLEKLRLAAVKADDAFEKLMGVPSEAGAKEVSKIKEAMTDLQKGGAAGVFKGIAEAVGNEPSMRAVEDDATEAERARLLMQKAKQEAPGFVPDVNDMLPELKDINKRLQEMDSALNEANNKRAAQLLGSAMQPGEEGANARTQLRMLINKYSKAFSEEFVKAMQKTLPDMIQGELDLEHLKANRAKSAGVAGQMLQGPIGTEMMLGGAPAGPVTPARLAAMMAKSQKRFGPNNTNKMIDEMTKAGLTEEQAQQVLGRMSPRATYDAAKALHQKNQRPLGPNGQVDGHILAIAVQELFAKAMKDVVGKPGGIAGKIGAQLKAAGADGDPKAVEAEMRAQLNDRIKQLMLERGLTAEQAKRVILQEQQQRAFGPGIPSQFVGIANFAKMIQTGALNGGGDIPKRQLEELMAIRRALQRPMQPQQPAVAGGPN